MGYLPKREKKSWVAPAPRRDRWKRANYPPWLTKFYNSSRWRGISKRNLTVNAYCVECKKQNIIKKADVTDHIIPAIQGGALYDKRNLQSLCHSHHNSKSASEANGTSEPYELIGKFKIPKRNA